MLEVSFYILPSASLPERDLFTCKLVEKAYRQGVYSFILTTSMEHIQIMDDLLWTFRPNSFVPHQCYANRQASDLQQVLISAALSDVPQGATLINLSPQYPEPLTHFDRILEIINQEPQILQAGRNRYRQYQQADAKLTTHKL
jgi:DNA polymerase III subunit chi